MGCDEALFCQGWAEGQMLQNCVKNNGMSIDLFRAAIVCKTHLEYLPVATDKGCTRSARVSCLDRAKLKGP
jgi:hypothetical protein